MSTPRSPHGSALGSRSARILSSSPSTAMPSSVTATSRVPRAEDRVVLQQVGHQLLGAEVVGGDEVDVGAPLLGGPEEVAADAAEAVDADADGHGCALLSGVDDRCVRANLTGGAEPGSKGRAAPPPRRAGSWARPFGRATSACTTSTPSSPSRRARRARRRRRPGRRASASTPRRRRRPPVSTARRGCARSTRRRRRPGGHRPLQGGRGERRRGRCRRASRAERRRGRRRRGPRAPTSGPSGSGGLERARRDAAGRLDGDLARRPRRPAGAADQVDRLGRSPAATVARDAERGAEHGRRRLEVADLVGQGGEQRGCRRRGRRARRRRSGRSRAAASAARSGAASAVRQRRRSPGAGRPGWSARSRPLLPPSSATDTTAVSSPAHGGRPAASRPARGPPPMATTRRRPRSPVDVAVGDGGVVAVARAAGRRPPRR